MNLISLANNYSEANSQKLEDSYVYETEGLWQYRLWRFQTGDTKLERFLPMNQHTQRKLLNFEN